MTCLHDGILRARLDGELAGEELNEVDQHLATCNNCRAHFEKLSANTTRTYDLLTSLSPVEGNTTNSAVAYAQFRNQFVTIAERKPSWADRLFAPRWRPVWGLVSAVVVIAILIGIDPIRGWSQRVLALLRVQKIAVVSIDPATLVSGSETDPKPYKLINQFFSDNVIVTINPGKPDVVTSVSKATQLAGYPVRAISSLGAPQAVLVRGETAFQMTVDRDRIETLLDGIGRSDIQIPESANGALIAVHIPKIVVSTYGDCPAPVTDTHDQALVERKARQLIKLSTNCTYFIQAGSPMVSVPPNLNMSEIAEAVLQLAGMSASEAHSFCQTVDWSSTMVVPIPRNSSSHETVTVDGVEGTLITENLSDGNRYSLLWIKNGVVHSLAGHGSSSDALALAASLR
ncbi:MAG TPA: zf-HC2 domain-containing protein [Terriglobales bacterium]|jgi:hypothetical protein